MSAKAAEYFSFVSGYVQDKETIRVIAQLDQLSEVERPNSTVMKWILPSMQRFDFHADLFTTRLSVSMLHGPEALVLSPDGRILVLNVAGSAFEHVDPAKDAIPIHGDLRDLRQIGEYHYVAGMRRQVYKREAPGRWTRQDSGTREAPTTASVSGFNSIDGMTEDDIYAVGFNGEIWRRERSQWKQVDSPTNLILNRVKVVSRELQYACGQMGVLLRGRGDAWAVVDHDSTEEQLWDLEWFNETLYVASHGTLYRLLPNDTLEPVDTGLGEDGTYGSLHANDGRLLSVGRKHVCLTEDGVHWLQIT